jgi:hypothetical protein
MRAANGCAEAGGVNNDPSPDDLLLAAPEGARRDCFGIYFPS